MKEIIILETVYGYVFQLEEQRIRYVGGKNSAANAGKIQLLLGEVQRRREEAIVFLNRRNQPVDIPRHLWEAAEKAEHAVCTALAHGDRELARRELQRTVRLCTTAAEASGAVEPHIPWDEWAFTFIDKDFDNLSD